MIFYTTNIKGKICAVVENKGKYYDADTLIQINQPENLEIMPLRLQDFYKNLLKNCIFDPEADTNIDQ